MKLWVISTVWWTDFPKWMIDSRVVKPSFSNPRKSRSNSSKLMKEFHPHSWLGGRIHKTNNLKTRSWRINHQTFNMIRTMLEWMKESIRSDVRSKGCKKWQREFITSFKEELQWRRPVNSVRNWQHLKLMLKDTKKKVTRGQLTIQRKSCMLIFLMKMEIEWKVDRWTTQKQERTMWQIGQGSF